MVPVRQEFRWSLDIGAVESVCARRENFFVSRHDFGARGMENPSQLAHSAMTEGKNILIVAGEISGDLHGAALVREMRAICTGMSFWGFGGQKMRDAGVETLVDVSQLAVMGLFDVVRHIPRIRGYMRRLLEVAQKRRPALAILIDYPGFNLIPIQGIIPFTIDNLKKIEILPKLSSRDLSLKRLGRRQLTR